MSHLEGLRKALEQGEDTPMIFVAVDRNYVEAYAKSIGLVDLEAAGRHLAQDLEHLLGLEVDTCVAVHRENLCGEYRLLNPPCQA